MDIKTCKYNEKRFCLLGFILFGVGGKEGSRGMEAHVIRDLEVKGVMWQVLEEPRSVSAQKKSRMKEETRKSALAEA